MCYQSVHKEIDPTTNFISFLNFKFSFGSYLIFFIAWRLNESDPDPKTSCKEYAAWNYVHYVYMYYIYIYIGDYI